MDLGKQSVADLANPQIIIKGRDACLDMGLTYRQEDWKKKLLWQFWDLNVYIDRRSKVEDAMPPHIAIGLHWVLSYIT